jgi:uncharacterized membrane protein
MERNKPAEKASKVIGIIGYLLISAFIAIFYVLAVLAVVLAVNERDMFYLTGLLGAAGCIWMLKSLRRTME